MREARLGLEHEGALLGDGLVVDAGRSWRRQATRLLWKTVGVAERGDAEHELVLLERD